MHEVLLALPSQAPFSFLLQVPFQAFQFWSSFWINREETSEPGEQKKNTWHETLLLRA